MREVEPANVNPDSIITFNTSLLEEAGPIVATIFVLFFIIVQIVLLLFVTFPQTQFELQEWC